MQRLIIGVLLAAGQSRRMGRLKQLMPWPSQQDPNAQPMVAAAFDAITPVCDRIVVVTGTRASEVVDALFPRDFHEAQSAGEAEMMKSVGVGLTLASQLDHSADVLLQLADHPRVQVATLQSMLNARQRFPGAAIIPEFEGRGGHPVLIPPEIVNELAHNAGEKAEFPGGLRAFWHSRTEDCHRIDTDDAWVTRDFDTPDDVTNDVT
jgi:molybdenum cofactor cytidylyltransferase